GARIAQGIRRARRSLLRLPGLRQDPRARGGGVGGNGRGQGRALGVRIHRRRRVDLQLLTGLPAAEQSMGGEMRESGPAHVEGPPTAVVERITDIARLPEWNDAIVEVVEQPVELGPGAVWKVRVRALGQTWVSKSMLLELDRAEGRFRHRSKTDDGNPSFA